MRGHLERANVGEGNANVLGLTTGVPAQHVRIAEDAAWRVPPHLFGHPGVGVRVFTQRRGARLAGNAVAAGNGKRDDDPVADLEVRDALTHLHDLAHELVTEDVALLHRRHEAVVKVQVRAADRGTRDTNDGVARAEDLRVRDVLNFDALLAHPAVGFHVRPRSFPGS
jgi:hypothetical protein